MSSRTKDKGKGKGKGHPKQYSDSSSSSWPTRWSDWKWSDEHSRYERYRGYENGDYEFEYDDAKSSKSEVPRIMSDPEQRKNLQEAAEASAVDSMTDSLGGLNFEDTRTVTGKNSTLVNVATKNPKTTHENLDPHYKVHHKNDFQWGRVFKILWAEPQGSTTKGGASIGNTEEVVGGRHTKVRRFVILKKGNGHCICLPIFTYLGQGVTKKGVHAEEHTIIYSDTPSYLDGEWEKGLKSTPIRMIPNDKRHKLDHASRLNYTKLYTIEYNVKVWFIGRIDGDSENQLIADYNRHNEKISHPSGGSGSSLPRTDTSAMTAFATGGGSQPSGMYLPPATPSGSSYGNMPGNSSPGGFVRVAPTFGQSSTQQAPGYFSPNPGYNLPDPAPSVTSYYGNYGAYNTAGGQYPPNNQRRDVYDQGTGGQRTPSHHISDIPEEYLETDQAYLQPAPGSGGYYSTTRESSRQGYD